MQRKGDVKDEVASNLITYLEREDPCMLFTRTQEELKTRDVWGYPVADTLQEQRYFQPLLKVQRRLSWRSALIGPDAVDRAVTDLLNLAFATDRCLLSIDFSGYDKSIGYNLQLAAFRYIMEMFQARYSLEIMQIARRFGTISLITPSGVWNPDTFQRHNHGVPSGSTFTNEIDSIAQALIAANSGVNVRLESQIQGDDGIYVTPDPDALKEGFSAYSLNVNEDKSHVSKDFCVYLQRYYSRNYFVGSIIGGIYPLYRALNRLIFQERFTDFTGFGISGADYYSIRAITILENCRYHPYFKEFVEFVVRMDREGLKFTREGLVAYIRMQQSKGIEEIQHKPGDDVKGLLGFATVKLIKEL
jgi:hypothetical protein